MVENPILGVQFLCQDEVFIQQGTMERVRVNPVVPGFAPDPSLVYVDGTYFVVNSTFHMYPGLPVYASRDLREWKHIGT